MHFTTRGIQSRLKELGFNPGEIDGVPGRNTTAAIKSFQQSNALLPDGIVGPRTSNKLFPGPYLDNALLPPWFELAMAKKGLREGADHAEVARFLKEDGSTVGDPAKVPWCGDFVETCIALTLPAAVLPTNPYLARNWMKFGQECGPIVGAVAVFWRTQKVGSTNGHVGFCAGLGDDTIYVLGGNQSNMVSVSPVDGGRLLGFRWPKGYPFSRIAPKMKGGKLSYDER